MYELRTLQFNDFQNGAEAEYGPMYLWYKFTNVAQRPLQPVLWPLLHTVQARNAERHLTNYCNVIPHADMVGPKVRTGDNMKKTGKFVARKPI